MIHSTDKKYFLTFNQAIYIDHPMQEGVRTIFYDADSMIEVSADEIAGLKLGISLLKKVETIKGRAWDNIEILPEQIDQVIVKEIETTINAQEFKII